MSLNEEIDILRRIPMFANMDSSKLKLLAFTSEKVSFTPEAHLLRQGCESDYAYILLEGECEVFLTNEHSTVSIATVCAHSIIGDITVLSGDPAQATIKATTNVQALKIHKDLFFRMLTEFPDMAMNVMRDLAHRIEYAAVKLREAHQTIHDLTHGHPSADTPAPSDPS